MNEEINLCEILKNCPKGWKFYTSLWGEVEFIKYDQILGNFLFNPINIVNINTVYIDEDGKYTFAGEYIIFPSKDQRDWSKFEAPWYKQKEKTEKFDPKTLQPFDKVLVRDYVNDKWRCDMFSHIDETDDIFPYNSLVLKNKYCIPYNNETKYLIGTIKEVPEYYKYWED